MTEAVLLDFDPHVVAFASQPFWLYWDDGRRMRRHAPDWFARLDDESGVVIDCRPPGRIGPRDQEAFDATGRACAAVGWRFRLVGEVDRMQSLNLRWLAGYRHPRYQGSEAVRARLSEVFAQPRELPELARSLIRWVCCRCSSTCCGPACCGATWRFRCRNGGWFSGRRGRRGEPGEVRGPAVG
ncbi:TnsA-like heteromeric transposase endonuclease subunit [Streptomyces sp. NPDC090798]|uniref:TnsA-like heteromeric transposase endonuclease subunit n=1 Tax=Streptomyces sp. NPDC090798 TaxID=3365968 RepID=UPI003807F680